MKLHRALLRQEAAFFDSTETGECISQLDNDVNKIGVVVSFRPCQRRSFQTNLAAMTSGEEWVQIAPDIAFQSKADDKNNDQQMNRAKTLAIERMLWNSKSQNQNSNSGPQSTSPYVVGYEDINQDWDSEQLAWHLLGFYIDCDSQEDDRNENNNKEEDHQRRDLSYGNTVCKRKVMYAVVRKIHTKILFSL